MKGSSKVDDLSGIDREDWVESLVGEIDALDEIEEQQHSWEAPLHRPWAAIEEDEAGNIRTSKHDEQRKYRKRFEKAKGRDQMVEKGIIRYVFLIVDTSATMETNDFRPSRKVVALRALNGFIEDFFDQNPISQMGIIVSQEKRARMLTDLSGNPHHQIATLQTYAEERAKGDFSLQNALELARSSLREVPSYGSREIIVVHSTLATTDPGDIFDTIEQMKSNKIRCSVISLSAESYVFKRLTEITNGHFCVALNVSHLGEVLREFLKPPVREAGGTRTREWVRMGFPHEKHTKYPTLCVCHGRYSYSGYECPRCLSKQCELPTQCQVCSLTLVSSPHLARSHHHLFPIALYRDVTQDYADNEDISCYACRCEINPAEELVLQCPKCERLSCFDCDRYVHEVSLENK